MARQEKESRIDTNGNGRIEPSEETEVEVRAEHGDGSSPDETATSQPQSVDGNNTAEYGSDNANAVSEEQSNAVESELEVAPVVSDSFIGTTDLLTQSFDTRFATAMANHDALRSEFDAFRVEMQRVMAKINLLESTVDAVTEPVVAMDRNSLLTSAINKLI